MRSKHCVTTLPFSGYSMYPFLKPGDRLVIRKTLPADIQTGDTLAFYEGHHHLTVHRVVKILPDRKFITKGDSLTAPDPLPVLPGAVEGKVAAILRGRRLIPVATGRREWFKKLYVWLSIRNLTWGVVKITIKQTILKCLEEKKYNSKTLNRVEAQRLLVDLIRDEKSDYPWARIDVKHLESAAVQEGAAGYIYPSVKKLGAPGNLVAVFKKHYLNIAARNLTGQAIIVKLESALKKEQISIILLKGASLQETIYHRPGLRMMEDFDIMIRPADRKRFIALLERHGFHADPGRSHCFIKGHTIIDLHTDALNTDRIENRKWLFPSGMNPVWNHSVPWREGFSWIRRPADTDNVLLLGQHAIKHSFGRTMWLVDIWLLLKQRNSGFWEELHARAVQLHQVRPLYQALFLLEREFNLDIKSPFKSPASYITRVERQLLILREDGQKDEYSGILLSFLSISGLKKRLAFAGENIFLKRATAQKEFGRSFAGRPARFYLARLRVSCKLAEDFARRLGASFIRQRRH